MGDFKGRVPLPLQIYHGVQNGMHSILKWFTSGEKLPRTHYKSITIMTGLLIIGLPTFYVWINAILKIKYYDSVDSVFALGVVSFLTLVPGLYVLFVTVCCWRKVHGFDWGMIPFFD